MTKAVIALLFLALRNTDALSPTIRSLRRTRVLMMESSHQNQPDFGRRDFVQTAAVGLVSVSALAAAPGSSNAFAIDPKASTPSKVLVAGATGKTGRLILQQLSTVGSGVTAIAGARTPSKVSSDVQAVKLDVTDSATLKPALEGVDAVVCATGFIPANPIGMGKAAHAVDNLGTVALVDAAKAAGIKKFVLVTSILTDAGAWGQRGSPGFVATNAFGGVLDEKLAAEQYLRSSGLDYTIVRPSGLKDTPQGKLVVSAENTINGMGNTGGEINRENVAKVCVQALLTGASANKVVEIYETKMADTEELPKEKWF